MCKFVKFWWEFIWSLGSHETRLGTYIDSTAQWGFLLLAGFSTAYAEEFERWSKVHQSYLLWAVIGLFVLRVMIAIYKRDDSKQKKIDEYENGQKEVTVIRIEGEPAFQESGTPHKSFPISIHRVSGPAAVISGRIEYCIPPLPNMPISLIFPNPHNGDRHRALLETSQFVSLFIDRPDNPGQIRFLSHSVSVEPNVSSVRHKITVAARAKNGPEDKKEFYIGVGADKQISFDQVVPRIEIIFGRNKDHVQVGRTCEMLFRVGLRLVDCEDERKIWCKMVEIRPLGAALSPQDRRSLATLKGLAFHKTHDTSNAYEHIIEPGRMELFDVIEEIQNSGWRLFFAAQSGVDPSVPPGKYELLVTAGGDGLSDFTKKFGIISSPKGSRLIFNDGN